ncbi:MAG: stage III sporulation protein AE [Clostridia bacterium]|nr:stage III sporulation protein AE [Clostridia bacterium]
MIKLLVLIFILINPINCLAADFSTEIYKDLEIYDYFNIESEIFPELNIEKLILSFENNEELNVNEILKSITEYFIKAITSHYKILAVIVITGFAISITNTISANDNSISHITFNISYSLYAILIISLFLNCIKPAKEMFDCIIILIKTTMPLFLSLLNLSGGITTSSMITSSLLMLIEVLTQIINVLVFPLIIASVTVSVANNMSDKINIGTLVNLMRQSAKWILGFTLALYTGFYGVYGLVGSSLDNRIGKAARYAIGRGIPVVGGVVSESIEAVMTTFGAVRNITGVAGIVMISIWGLVPIIKTAVYILIFKFSAIILEPVSDKRIISLTNETSEAISLIMSVLIAVCLLFVGCVGILLITGNFID